MTWRQLNDGKGCLHGLGRHIVGPVNDTNAGQAKVCQLDVPLAGDQQVVWLQIAMNDCLQEQTRAQSACDCTAFSIIAVAHLMPHDAPLKH